jgi:hypothetical protein
MNLFAILFRDFGAARGKCPFRDDASGESCRRSGSRLGESWKQSSAPPAPAELDHGVAVEVVS